MKRLWFIPGFLILWLACAIPTPPPLPEPAEMNRPTATLEPSYESPPTATPVRPPYNDAVCDALSDPCAAFGYSYTDTSPHAHFAGFTAEHAFSPFGRWRSASGCCG